MRHAGRDQDESMTRLPENPVSHPQKFPAVLLFGMPGVGKGTQGTLLGTMNGMFHVSTGAIFRGLDENSEQGREIHARIDRGELVPDDLTVRIWRGWLDEEIAAGRYVPQQETLVLDGIPRNVAQCRLLEDHVEVVCVIHLAPESDDPIVDRLRKRALMEGRSDDADEAIIRRRFEIYREKTEPVLHYYPQELVHTVNPLGTQMEIKKRILELVIPAVRSHQQAG